MTRGLKILIILVSIGMLAGIVLALALPGGKEESKAQSEGQEVVQEATAGEGNQGQSETGAQENAAGGANQTGNSAAQGGSPSVTINPNQGGGGAPGLTVNFPDPVGGGEQKPPDGYSDLYGQWIAELTGSSYGLKNCYLSLESNGNISAPDNYLSVFEIVTSQFKWQSGSPDFAAEVQAVLKLGNQNQIPLKIELTGQVSESLDNIQGTFSAVPQNETFAAYAQQGNFTLHR